MRACRLPALALLLLAAPAHAGPLDRARTRERPRRMDPAEARSTTLGLYLTPLFGYETNYRLLPPRLDEQPQSAEITGSAVWTVEAGAELEHHRPGGLHLQLELGGMARMPLADSALLEGHLEAPLLLSLPLGRRLELRLSNQLGFERARTPPVFLPEQVAIATPGATITYDAIHDSLRAACGFQLSRWATLELATYARIKWVDLRLPAAAAAQDAELIDYWLADLGVDLAARLRYGRALTLRLRYDLASRWFPGQANIPARRPDFLLLRGGPRLSMLRHLLGVYLRARLPAGTQLRLSYAARVVADSGGFYSSLDHLLGLALAYSYADRVALQASVGYTSRNYVDRDELGYEGKGTTPVGELSPQILAETSLAAEGRLEVNITEWMQLVATYQLELADADIESAIVNHRVLGGVTLFR